MFVAGWQRRAPNAGGSGAQGVDTASPAATDQVTLYFVAGNGLALVERETQLPPEEVGDDVPRGRYDPMQRARLVLERQLAPPPAPLTSPVPEGTGIRAVYLTTTGDAFIDLTGDVSRGHAGGSLDELFTVYALVNALTTNVPEISAVQILVEGHEVDTLAGHVDLRHPLARNMKWVAEPVNGAQFANASTAEE